MQLYPVGLVRKQVKKKYSEILTKYNGFLLYLINIYTYI